MQRSEPKQLVLLGPERSGKTTILYKLKIPKWTTVDMKTELQNLKKEERDILSNNKNADPHGGDFGYHYEELNEASIGEYGMWDVPGSDVMVTMWPTFYRYVKVAAVLYVVDVPEKRDESEEVIDFKCQICDNTGRTPSDEICTECTFGDKVKLNKAKRLLHFLLNEDELRMSAFVLILNVKDPKSRKDAKPDGKNTVETGAGMKGGQAQQTGDVLGVEDLSKQRANKERFKIFTLCAATLQPTDAVWKDVILEIHKVGIQLEDM